jgi:enterochelin esterase-like enzyme
MKPVKTGLATLIAGAAFASITYAANPAAPEVHPDGLVTFRLKAPDATSVTLNSDWPGGSQQTRATMTKDAQGMWSITLGPLKPDLWTYSFSVNGVKVPDDANPHFGFDRWGSAYFSYLLIPGEASRTYETQEVPHGTVSAIWYPAPSLTIKSRRAVVYTPPGYESGRSHYPVLYLTSNEETGWLMLGRAPTIMDNLIASGKAKPMIVVMLNTQPDAAAATDLIDEAFPSTVGLPSRLTAEKNPHGGSYGSPALLKGGLSIANDLVPFIDQAFRTKPDRDHRAVVGMSSSGAASFYGAMKNLDKFAYIGIFSGAFSALPGAWVEIPTPANAAQFLPEGPDIRQSADMEKVGALMPEMNSKANLRLLYLSIGESDGLLTTHERMKRLLDERGVKYVSVEVPGQRHDWRFWRWALADFTSRLF